MKNKVHSFFNKTHNYLHQSFGIRVRAEITNDLIGHPSERSILDVGCGNGGISLRYLQQNRVTFLDLSENMIALVKQSIPIDRMQNASFNVGSFDDIELSPIYDYIFAIGLLAHIPSVQGALDRIYYLLKDNGRAVIQFSDSNHWLTQYNIRNSSHYGYKINELTHSSMMERIQQSGFRLERSIQFSFLLPGLGRLPDKLMYRYGRMFWKNKMLSSFGTDYMWLLQKSK